MLPSGFRQPIIKLFLRLAVLILLIAISSSPLESTANESCGRTGFALSLVPSQSFLQSQRQPAPSFPSTPGPSSASSPHDHLTSTTVQLTRPSFHPPTVFVIHQLHRIRCLSLSSSKASLQSKAHSLRPFLFTLHCTALHSDSRSVEERRHTGQHVHQVRDIVSRNAATPLFETNRTVDPSDQLHHRRLIILIPSIPLAPRYLSQFGKETK